MRCGAQCLDDFYSTVRGKALRGGYITVLHTHGRNGQYHPHLHVLATSGGMMPRESAGRISSTCPTTFCVANGSGTSSRCVRKTLATEGSTVGRCVFTHIPTDLVVAQEASDVESSSRLDFLLLHNLYEVLHRLMRSSITSTISTA